LIPKNRGERFSIEFLHSDIFGRGEPLCRHSTNCCFVRGSYCYNQVFVHYCQSRWTGNHLDTMKNSKRCSDNWHRWSFWTTFVHFGTHLAEIWNPLILQDYLVNFINNIRRGHSFGSSTTRRITGGNITTYILGGIRCWCSPNVPVRMACISFRALPWRKKNLMTARVRMLLKSRAAPDMLSFGLCRKEILANQNTNRPLFPTTLSIPFYDIGK